MMIMIMERNHQSSVLLSILDWSFLISLIIGFGYAAVLPETTKTTSQHPIVGEGIRVAYVKTKFSCVGRPSGYYADVDTGCELYHMCDGLGRQFSYACPNTTLFQQRMLICDHWYMVNCSKAEGDYSANLLIGQRDKPFVAEEENELRTPRPDLKDRPYSADYSGESFRRHYKHHLKSPAGNSIGSESNNVPEYAPIHWSTSNRQNEGNQSDIVSDPAKTVNGLLVYQMPTGFSKPEIVKSVDVTGDVKIPSIIFELPDKHPDYTHVQQSGRAIDEAARKIHLSPSAFAKAFEASTNSNQLNVNAKEYDAAKQFKAKGVAVDPIQNVVANQIPLTTTRRPEITTTRSTPTTTITSTTTKVVRTTTTEQSPIAQLQETANRILPNAAIPEPIDGLQPPHTFYRTYDDATTEGPPIYYQWKWAVPAFVLEPPKFNDPVAPEIKDVKTPTARSVDEKNTANAGDDSSLRFNHGFFKKTLPQPEHNFLQLQKSLDIPSFEFPLEVEADAQNAFSNSNALNSYQLKIPANARSEQSWYGENKKCPECHPAFLQPGTCEPCVKR